LSGKEGQVKKFNIAKAKTTKVLWLCHILPRDPASAPFPFLSSPPEVEQQSIDMLA
jgi:hypothetical protein